MGYLLIYKKVHGSLNGAMARPLNAYATAFQLVKIMQLTGLNSEGIEYPQMLQKKY